MAALSATTPSFSEVDASSHGAAALSVERRGDGKGSGE